MRISTKGQYAIEIMVDLAIHSKQNKPESLKKIAERRKLSEKYLERIIKVLKEAELVTSTRGAYGGYYLAKDPGKIVVKEILEVVEGKLTPVDCLIRETDCGIDCETCPTRNMWNQMRQEIMCVVGGVTITDIMKSAKGH